MNKTTTVLLAVGAGFVVLLLLLFGFYVSSYNTLVGLDEDVSLKWANLQSAYQRRADLIPNIVATVEGSSDFEQETLTAVVDARSKATQVKLDAASLGDASAVKAFESAQGELSSTLSRLLVSVERYPDIKSTQAYRDLIVELEGSENRIKVERDNFNAAVKNYNVVVRRFPSSIVAGIAGFDKKEAFTADEGSDQAPVVDFS